MDPEEGIEAAIYAKNKAIDYSFINEENAGFGMPLGFQGIGENDSEDVGGMKVYGGNSLADAAMTIGMCLALVIYVTSFFCILVTLVA